MGSSLNDEKVAGLRLEDLLSQVDADFVESVLKMVSAADPGSCAMCTVAYLNLVPIVEGAAVLAKEYENKSMLKDLDGVIRLIARTNYRDEVGSKVEKNREK